MSSLHRITLHALDGNSTVHHFSIDGRPVHARSVDLRVAVDEVPTAQVEFAHLAEVDELARVEAIYHPKTVAEAGAVLRGAIMTDVNMKAAWVSSIASGIADYMTDCADNDRAVIDFKNIAKAVLQRILDDH